MKHRAFWIFALSALLVLASMGASVQASPKPEANQYQVMLPWADGPEGDSYVRLDVFWGTALANGSVFQRDDLLFIMEDGASMYAPSEMAPMLNQPVFPLDPSDLSSGNSLTINPTSTRKGNLFEFKVHDPNLKQIPFNLAGVGNGVPIPGGAYIGTVLVAAAVSGALLAASTPVILVAVAAVGVGIIAYAVIHQIGESLKTADMWGQTIPPYSPHENIAKSRVRANARQWSLAAEQVEGSSREKVGEDELSFPTPPPNDPCQLMQRFGGFNNDLFELRVLRNPSSDWPSEKIRVEIWERSSNTRVAYAYGDIIKGESGDVAEEWVDTYVSVSKVTAGGQYIAGDGWATVLLLILNDLMSREAPGTPIYFIDKNSYTYGCYKSFISQVVEQLSSDEIIHFQRTFYGSPQMPRGLPDYFNM